MRTHTEVASRTFAGSLTPLQATETEIVPQGVSIALSIRELLRQAYLYSAGIPSRSAKCEGASMQFARASQQGHGLHQRHRPNHALQPTPWNAVAFPSPLVRRG